ncbi:MAG: hypothetical protein WC026_16100 [Hyphomicrobium sp.]
MAWLQTSGTIIRREEIKVLQIVDAAYVAAVNDEIADQLKREKGDD